MTTKSVFKKNPFDKQVNLLNLFYFRRYTFELNGRQQCQNIPFLVKNGSYVSLVNCMLRLWTSWKPLLTFLWGRGGGEGQSLQYYLLNWKVLSIQDGVKPNKINKIIYKFKKTYFRLTLNYLNSELPQLITLGL